MCSPGGHPVQIRRIVCADAVQRSPGPNAKGGGDPKTTTATAPQPHHQDERGGPHPGDTHTMTRTVRVCPYGTLQRLTASRRRAQGTPAVPRHAP